MALAQSGAELPAQDSRNYFVDPTRTPRGQGRDSDLYLNQIYLGSGAYGVETAASYTQAMEAWKERFSFSSR